MYQWNTSRVSKGHLVQEGKIIFASEGLLYFMIILIAFSNGAGVCLGYPTTYQPEG